MFLNKIENDLKKWIFFIFLWHVKSRKKAYIEIYINSYLMSADNCHVIAFIVTNNVNAIKIWENWKGQ